MTQNDVKEIGRESRKIVIYIQNIHAGGTYNVQIIWLRSCVILVITVIRTSILHVLPNMIKVGSCRK